MQQTARKRRLLRWAGARVTGSIRTIVPFLILPPVSKGEAMVATHGSWLRLNRLVEFASAVGRGNGTQVRGSRRGQSPSTMRPLRGIERLEDRTMLSTIHLCDAPTDAYKGEGSQIEVARRTMQVETDRCAPQSPLVMLSAAPASDAGDIPTCTEGADPAATYTFAIGPNIQDNRRFPPVGTGNDSIWIDLGYPVRTTADGQRFKPLFAFYIQDLDNRVNVNVTGAVGRCAAVTTGQPLLGNLFDYKIRWGVAWYDGLGTRLATDPTIGDSGYEQTSGVEMRGALPRYWIFGTELPVATVNEAHAESRVPNNTTIPALPHCCWLVHLDRQVISPLEQWHVSGFAPGELSNTFIDRK